MWCDFEQMMMKEVSLRIIDWYLVQKRLYGYLYHADLGSHDIIWWIDVVWIIVMFL